MVSQCQAGVSSVPYEFPDLMNYSYAASPADESAIAVRAIALPGDVNSVEYDVTPVPKPATIMLLGLGCLLTLPLKRR